MKKLDLSPFTHDQLSLLAMGKARGYSWEEMARQSELPLELIQRIAWTHEKVWNRYLTKAERYVARETLTEVASVLRRDVATTDAKQRPTTVNSLTRVLQLQQELAQAARPPRRSVPNSIPISPTSPPTLHEPPTPICATPMPAKPEAAPVPAATPLLKTTIAAVLLFVLTCFTFLLGGANNSQRDAVARETLVCEARPVASHTNGARVEVAGAPPTPTPPVREGPNVGQASA